MLKLAVSSESRVLQVSSNKLWLEMRVRLDRDNPHAHASAGSRNHARSESFDAQIFPPERVEPSS